MMNRFVTGFLVVFVIVFFVHASAPKAEEYGNKNEVGHIHFNDLKVHVKNFHKDSFDISSNDPHADDRS